MWDAGTSPTPTLLTIKITFNKNKKLFYKNVLTKQKLSDIIGIESEIEIEIEMKLHDGMILNADYIRNNFILDSTNDYIGIEYYTSKDGNYCCQLYKNSTEAQLERNE